ncbi:hypothetical protein D3C76_312840 [compost metagenome]
METNKMREQFEVAYLAEMKRLYGITGAAENNLAWRRPDGDYVDPMLRLAFWAWQASREAVVVELPVEPYASQGMSQPSYGDALKDCRVAIKAQGLKVSP